jgi:hypothetical protein
LGWDPRVFDDVTKVPQVFRNGGGSPALQNERYIRCQSRYTTIFSRLLTLTLAAL